MHAFAPTLDGSIYTFTLGETVFAVDAAKAGRVVEFSLAGRNILTAARGPADNNWGSTFWTSPQSDWGWPPPEEIDSAPCRAELSGATLALAGETARTLGLAVSKRFSLDRAAAAVVIDYGIANRGKSPRAVAPWEITRVAAGGLTFFPTGEGGLRRGDQGLLAMQQTNGVAWFAYDADKITDHQKVFADGREGWIAHVAGDLLLVKAWADIAAPDAAPGEGEIEIYADPTHSYVEVENQGGYVTLPPGQSLVWSVRWFLRKLDPSLELGAGSPALTACVRALLAQGR